MVPMVVDYLLDMLEVCWQELMAVAAAHRLVLWLEGLTELLAMMDWLAGSLEPLLGREVVMTGHYLGRRELWVAMVRFVHHHTPYSFVAHGHCHGGPDPALVLGSADSSLVQHHCWTYARHHHWILIHAPCIQAYH